MACLLMSSYTVCLAELSHSAVAAMTRSAAPSSDSITPSAGGDAEACLDANMDADAKGEWSPLAGGDDRVAVGDVLLSSVEEPSDANITVSSA